MEERAGNMDEARRLLALGLQANPFNVWAMQASGRLERLEGNCDAARALFSDALDIEPDNSAVLQVRLLRTLIINERKTLSGEQAHFHQPITRIHQNTSGDFPEWIWR
jgi:predicted Zn-dependent protease